MLGQTMQHRVKRYAVKVVVVVGYVLGFGLLSIGCVVLSEFMGWDVGVPLAE